MLERRNIGAFVVIVAVLAFASGSLLLIILGRGSEVEITLPTAELEVSVDGAVSTAGTYMLPAGSNVGDLVRAAGGFATNADATALDVSRLLEDGELVTLPARCLDINTATAEEFDSLPNIGPTRAADIVDYRTENGDFESVDDLAQVRGIGAATIANIMETDCIKVEP